MGDLLNEYELQLKLQLSRAGCKAQVDMFPAHDGAACRNRTGDLFITSEFWQSKSLFRFGVYAGQMRVLIAPR